MKIKNMLPISFEKIFDIKIKRWSISFKASTKFLYFIPTLGIVLVPEGESKKYFLIEFNFIVFGFHISRNPFTTYMFHAIYVDIKNNFQKVIVDKTGFFPKPIIK